MTPGHLYTVEKCEDTGRPAIYALSTHGGGPARILIAHDENLWELYSTLAKHMEQKASNGI